MQQKICAVGNSSDRERAARAYRELIVTTPGLSESISGAILYDETIRQLKSDGTPFAKAFTEAGIIPGIKVDTGAKDMAGHPGEAITEGLDGLRDRLQEYSSMGARFTKWRAIIAVGEGMPSRGCVEANAHALARYAALAQEAGLVPVVEPEVLMAGAHSLRRCFEVTEQVLRTVFKQLYAQRVLLEGMILKPNMVLPGLTAPEQEPADKVAAGLPPTQSALSRYRLGETRDDRRGRCLGLPHRLVRRPGVRLALQLLRGQDALASLWVRPWAIPQPLTATLSRIKWSDQARDERSRVWVTSAHYVETDNHTRRSTELRP